MLVELRVSSSVDVLVEDVRMDLYSYKSKLSDIFTFINYCISYLFNYLFIFRILLIFILF